jgi:CubicO group peptidase (beta-lactamase class C family)
VVRDGQIIASGAVGIRRAGAEIPVTINDRFHLDSDTKAMTALLAAMLVDEGKLRWDSTVAQVFPELAPNMNPGLRGVTLEQLLSHTSGLPSDNQAFGNLLMKSLSRGGNLDEMRYWGGPAVESTAIGVQVGYQVRLRQHELRHCRRHA